MKAGSLHAVVLRHLSLSLEVARLLQGLVARKPIRGLTVHGCGFDSTMLAELCLGVIAGKSLELLDLSNNEIGLLDSPDRFGVNFLCSLIRYYEPLARLDLSHNAIKEDSFQLLERANQFLKRSQPLLIKLL